MVVTILCLLLFFVIDKDQALELQAFDWRIRHFNQLMPSTPIIHLDIDDNSLDRVGRWPWRRSQTADLLRALNEFKPACVMIDLLLSEPERPYDDDPRLDEGTDLGLKVEVLGGASEENRVYGDLELADAVRSGGNVVMASQFETRDPRDLAPMAERLREWWSSNKSAKSAAAIQALKLPETRQQQAQVEKELFRLRMQEELLDRFTLSDLELAQRLHVSPADVASIVAGVKTAVAQELVARYFDEEQSPEAVMLRILGDHKDRLNADRKDVLDAIRERRGIIALRKATFPIDPTLAGRINRAKRPVPLLYPLARAARDIAAVNFSADADGAVRRVPILLEYDKRGLAHMGLTAARAIKGLELEKASLSGDRVLVIPESNGDPLRMPLDEGGNLIIP